MDNIILLPPRKKNDPPTAACELCPMPREDGETCFCAVGFDLVYQGIRKIQEKWPTMTEEDAAFLVGEQVIQDAAIVAGAACGNAAAARRFQRMLIEQGDWLFSETKKQK